MMCLAVLWLRSDNRGNIEECLTSILMDKISFSNGNYKKHESLSVNKLPNSVLVLVLDFNLHHV